jgi:hypothetical protein
LIDIRPIKEQDLPQARLLIPQNCAEPNWNYCHVVEQDGEVVGLIGIETRLVAEPVYIKKGANGAALMAFGWLDGYMRKIAQGVGFGGYEFFVGNEQSKEWHEFIKNRLPVTAGLEKPGMYYFRSFNGKIKQPETSGTEQPSNSASAT